MNPFKRLYHPEFFQGKVGIHRRREYFEGWYFKFSSPHATYAWIPGVALGKTAADEHGFVQTNNSITGHTGYEKYSLNEFIQDTKRFQISVGPNSFSLEGLSVNLPDMSARLSFHDVVRWPSTVLAPSSMGPYAFVPSMECYHGILILDAAATGTIDGEDVQGRMYVEKDWGRSFPEGWVWLQANRFSGSATFDTGDSEDGDETVRSAPSLTCSIARVPFRGKTFPGFIIGLYVPDMEPSLVRFTPYNGAEITRLDARKNSVGISISRRDWTLEIESQATSEHEPRLISPIDGRMEGTLTESLDARIDVRLKQGNETVYAASSDSGGLEIVNPQRIL